MTIMAAPVPISVAVIPATKTSKALPQFASKVGSLSHSASSEMLASLRGIARRESVTQKDIVSVVGGMLMSMATKSDTELGDQTVPPSAFSSASVPRVSFTWYLWRLVHYLNKWPAVEPCFFASDERSPAHTECGVSVTEVDNESAVSRGMRCLLLALVYIDRICTQNTGFRVTSFSLHRVTLSAVLAASKFTDDFPLGCDIFARLGGIGVKEMQKLELEFCSLIHFNFLVSDMEFQTKCIKAVLQPALEIAIPSNPNC